MLTFRTFPNPQEARDFRHQHGTGGWIFVPADDGECILFPPDFPPSTIWRHPFTHGRSGGLLAI